MKKYLLIALTSLILSACGQSNTSSVTLTSTPVQSQKTTLQSLKDLLTLGTAQKCTWSFTENGKNITGTIIINGQKFKQTISMPVEDGKTINTTNIGDGTDFYSWSDASKVGFKMNIVESQKLAPTGTETNQSQSSVDWDKKYNYECSPITVSDSEFNLPSDIKFTDMADTLKKLQDLNLDELKKIGSQ